VDILGYGVPRSPEHEHVEEGAGQPFLGPEHVGGFHGVVVDDVGQVVGGEAVALQDDGVHGEVGVFLGDGPQDLVLHHRGAVQGHGEPDHRLPVIVGRPGALDVPFAFREVAAPAVVALGQLGFLLFLAQGVEAGRGAEALVGRTALHQGLGVGLVQVQPLALDVGTKRPPLVRTLVPFQARPPQTVVEIGLGLGVVPALVGIFDAQIELSALGLGEQVVEQGGPQTPDVLEPRG